MQIPLLLGFGLILAAGGQAEPWPFRIEWVHSGAGVTEFQLCRAGECSVLAAQRSGVELWSAPLPLLPEGLHTLTVFACNAGGCTAGNPAMVVEVRANRPTTVSDPGNATNPPPQSPGPTKAPPRHPPRVS
jgi:hypothetical protein